MHSSAAPNHDKLPAGYGYEYMSCIAIGRSLDEKILYLGFQPAPIITFQDVCFISVTTLVRTSSRDQPERLVHLTLNVGCRAGYVRVVSDPL